MDGLSKLQYAMLSMGIIGALATLWLGYRALFSQDRREDERRSEDRRMFKRGNADRRQLGRRNP